MNLLHSIKALENDSVVNVVIEIPCGSKEKIEYDIDQEKFIVDRVLNTSLSFPFNYGFVPETWSTDNDPLDVTVISSETLPTGSQIKTRLIGMLNTTDQEGSDTKLIAVPIDEKNSKFSKINSLDKQVLDNINYFYKNYKIYEPGKWVDINGYFPKEQAVTVLSEAIERYHQHFQK